MAQENIKITLPISKLECELKSYVTHRLSQEVQKLLIGDKEIDVSSSTDKDKIAKEMVLNGEQAIEMKNILVKGLVVRIGDLKKSDGTLTEDDILDMAEGDFSVIADRALELFNGSKNDPKALKDGSKNITGR